MKTAEDCAEELLFLYIVFWTRNSKKKSFLYMSLCQYFLRLRIQNLTLWVLQGKHDLHC